MITILINISSLSRLTIYRGGAMAMILIYLDNKEYNKIRIKAYRKHISVEKYIEDLIIKDIEDDKDEALAN